MNTNSLSLDGSGYAIMAADSATLSITGNYTFETWIKFTALPGSGVEHFFMAKSQTSGDQRGYRISLNNNAGTLQIKMYANAAGDAPGNTSTTVNWTPVTGVWYHLANTYTAATGTFELFVNAASQGTGGSLATSNLNNTAFFMIGGGNDGSDVGLTALMDEARMWNAIRTSTQIAEYMSKELNGNETGIQGYWRLNGDYNDLTANANHLAAGGAGNTFSSDVPFKEVSSHAFFM